MSGVRNAADPAQVGRASRAERRREANLVAATRAVLGTVEGRLFVAELLEAAGIDTTVYDAHGSAMYFKEGRRNFGLEIKARAIDADEQLFELMDREHRARRRGEQAETEAVRTPAAGGVESNG